MGCRSTSEGGPQQQATNPAAQASPYLRGSDHRLHLAPLLGHELLEGIQDLGNLVQPAVVSQQGCARDEGGRVGVGRRGSESWMRLQELSRWHLEAAPGAVDPRWEQSVAADPGLERSSVHTPHIPPANPPYAPKKFLVVLLAPRPSMTLLMPSTLTFWPTVGSLTNSRKSSLCLRSPAI